MYFWSEIKKEDDTVLRILRADSKDTPTWAKETETTYWVIADYTVEHRGILTNIFAQYLPEYDEFVRPKPFPSWVFDEDKFDWVAPVAHPDPDPFVAHLYDWNEEAQAWDFVEKVNVKEGY